MKRTYSIMISVAVIAVGILSIYIGQRSGVLDQIKAELPTLEEQTREISVAENKTENAENDNETKIYKGAVDESVINEYMNEGEIKELDNEKPYGGLVTANVGDNFELEDWCGIDSSTGKDVIEKYELNVKNVEITRECKYPDEIDIEYYRNEWNLDENDNFISDYYYLTVEIDMTRKVRTDGYDLSQFGETERMQSVWTTWCLNSDGTRYTDQISKTSEPVGNNSGDNVHGCYRIYPGDSITMRLHYVVSEIELNRVAIALRFDPQNSPYTGPWVILHRPEDGVSVE